MRRAFELIRILGTLTFVGLTIWLLDVRTTFAVLERVEIGYFFLASVLSCLVLIITALKWRIVLPTVSFRDLVRIVFIGQFYSFFFLGQATGEAAKIYLLSKNLGNMSGAAASSVADRLTSLVGFLTVSLLGFALSSIEFPPALQWLSITILSVCLAFLLSFRLPVAVQIALRLTMRMEAASRIFVYSARAFRNAIAQWHSSVRDLRRLSAALFLGVLIQLGNVCTLAILASGIQLNLPFADWCWIMGIMSVAGLIPLSIGQVTANGTLVGLLHVAGVSLNDALAVSIMSLLTNFLIAVLGAIEERLRVRKIQALRTANLGSTGLE
jgi:uncharacterized protein (TIRG00374 family)